MSLSSIQADLADARAALLSGDYDTALLYATAAQTTLAGMPNQRQGPDSIDFDAQKSAIDGLIANITKQQAKAIASSSTASRRRSVTYVNPEDTGTY